MLNSATATPEVYGPPLPPAAPPQPAATDAAFQAPAAPPPPVAAPAPDPYLAPAVPYATPTAAPGIPWAASYESALAPPVEPAGDFNAPPAAADTGGSRFSLGPLTASVPVLSAQAMLPFWNKKEPEEITEKKEATAPSANATEGDSALIWGAGEGRPSSKDLDAGVYGLAGVQEEKGPIRRFVTHPSLQKGEKIESQLEEGTEIKKGDVLYTIRNSEIEGRVDTAKVGLDQANTNLQPAIDTAQRVLLGQKADVQAALARAESQELSLTNQIAQSGVGIATLDAQIENQTSAVQSANADVVERRILFDRVVNSGLLPGDGISQQEFANVQGDLSEAQSSLNEKENVLLGLQDQRRSLIADQGTAEDQLSLIAPEVATRREQLSAIEQFGDVTPESVMAQIRSGNVTNIPPDVLKAGFAVQTAETVLKRAEDGVDALSVRAEMDGIVVQNLPTGLLLNTLDGTGSLNNSTNVGLGSIESDPERINDAEPNDGGTPAIIPDPTRQATIQIQGVNQTQAEKFELGEDVMFRTSDGQLGMGEVAFNEADSEGTGYKIKIENPRFLDGEALTAAERRPIQVYSEGSPEVRRSIAQTTEQTVTLADPGERIEAPGELPMRDQEFEITIPIYAETTEDGEEPLVVANVRVSGTTRSNNRETEVIEQKAFISAAGSDASVPVEVNISLDENFSGGSNAADSARVGSGAKMQVSVPFIAQNGTLAFGETEGSSDTITVDPEFGLEKGEEAKGLFSWLQKHVGGFIDRGGVSGSRTGSSSDTLTLTDLPPAQQFSVPVYFTPSGDIDNGDTVRITTPEGVNAKVSVEDRPTLEDVKDAAGS